MMRCPVRMPSVAAGVALVGAILAASVSAQLPITELHAVFPPAASVESEQQVTISGSNLEQVDRLLFTHEGIVAEPVMQEQEEFASRARRAPNQFQVTVAANVPPGIYEVRAAGRYGLSNPRTFVVESSDIQTDPGSNHAMEQATELTSTAVVFGRADANARDHYRVPLSAGERLFVRCDAGLLDSRLQPIIERIDETGRRVQRMRSIGDRPAVLDVTAETDQVVTFTIYDSVFRGGADYPYRLTLHHGPHVDYVFPPVAVPGETTTVTVFGRALPGGKPVPEMQVDGQPLESIELTVTPAAEPAAGDPGTRSTLAQAIETQLRIALPGLGTVSLAVAAGGVQREAEPNDQATTATPLTLPADAAAQFYPARDVDWYQFDAVAGQVWILEVLDESRGAPVDGAFLLQRVDRNESGEESVSDVVFMDDVGDRNGRIGSDFDTSNDNPWYRLAVPEDGTYRLMVRDQFTGAAEDPRRLYRLVIRPEQPDFRVVACAYQIKVANNNQVLMFAPFLRMGGNIPVRVQVQRLDGFSGPIRLHVEGLPDGVTATPGVIAAGANTGWVILQAAEEVAPWEGTLQVFGTADIGEREVRHAAVPGYVVWGTGNRTQQRPVFRASGALMLSISEHETFPAVVQAGDGQVVETARGAQIEIPVRVTRRGEWKENVPLAATGLPNEIRPQNLQINGDAEEGRLVIQLNNNNTRPGEYTFYLVGNTKTQLVRDPDAIRIEEEEQAHVTTVLEEIARQLEAAQTAQAGAATRAETATAEKEARAAELLAAEQRMEAAQEMLESAREDLAAARQVAAEEPDNEEAAKALTAAEARLEEAEAFVRESTELLEDVRKAAAAATTAAEEAAAELQEADEALAEVQQRKERADAYKAVVDKRLDDARKANAPGDVNIALVSTPIHLSVAATPATISLPQEAWTTHPGQNVDVPVSLERLFGFNQNLQLTLEVPNGVGGVRAGQVNVGNDAAEGTMTIQVAENAPVGEHRLTIRGRGRFNNVNVETTAEFLLRIEEEPPSDPESESDSGDDGDGS